MAPTPEQLLVQLIRLSRAQFDMRSAGALAYELSRGPNDGIGAYVYGLYTGLAVSYARPFSGSNTYGPLESKWETFAGRPELRNWHKHLLDDRNTLLAHNDLSPHRVTLAWPGFQEDGVAILEARAPLNPNAPAGAQELCMFQEQRFGVAAQELANKLEPLLGWGDQVEINLDEELARLRAAKDV